MGNGVGRNSSKIFICSIFVSYFIFMLTYGVGSLRYSHEGDLNFVEFKFNEVQSKYDYIINNINVGNIEENNREVLYLEEIRDEISKNLEREGEFWLIDLKNIIKHKQDMLINGFLDNSKNYKESSDYMKLKNEIDEYSTYYNLKCKPLDYNESRFIRYFSLMFNSRVHQIALTIVVLSVFIVFIRFTMYDEGLWKLFWIITLPIVFMQILIFTIWIAADKNFDPFYPTRIVKNFGLDFSIRYSIIPFYKIVIFTVLVEVSYVLFLVSFLKIIDTIFNTFYLKIFGIFIFMLGMISILFTNYSGISFISYGKFLDITRGYEFLYRKGEFFNIYSFLISILVSIFLYGFVRLRKKIYSK